MYPEKLLEFFYTILSKAEHLAQNSIRYGMQCKIVIDFFHY